MCFALNAHSVYTRCNHFMDIFERHIVKCQIRLFAPLRGLHRGRSASMCVCGERFNLIVSFQWALKGEKRSNIYCLDCHGLQDKHGPSIVLIITGIKLVMGGGGEEKAKELSKTSSCPDVHKILRSTNVTST